jgi:DNA-binding SARP family transcriptional activator
LTDLSATAVWSPADQYRYQESYLSALEELGTIYEHQGKGQEARESYLKALAAAPWRETAARKLMRILMKAGDRAAAVQVCRRLHETLDSELGVEPCPETRLLCQELMCN